MIQVFQKTALGNQLSYWGTPWRCLDACLPKDGRTFVSGDSLNCQVKNLAEEEWTLLWELCEEMLAMASSYLQRWERILVLRGFSPHPSRALFCFQSHRWWHRKASVSLKQQEKPLGVGDLNCNALALHTVHGGGLGSRMVLKEKGNWQTVGITQLKQRLRGWETGQSVNSRRRDLGHHTYLFCSGASCVKWWLWFYPKLCRTCAWLVW